MSENPFLLIAVCFIAVVLTLILLRRTFGPHAAVLKYVEAFDALYSTIIAREFTLRLLREARGDESVRGSAVPVALGITVPRGDDNPVAKLECTLVEAEQRVASACKETSTCYVALSESELRGIEAYLRRNRYLVEDSSSEAVVAFLLKEQALLKKDALAASSHLERIIERFGTGTNAYPLPTP